MTMMMMMMILCPVKIVTQTDNNLLRGGAVADVVFEAVCWGGVAVGFADETAWLAGVADACF